jgi:hypothetical protein
MAKQIITINGEDMTLREDTSKSYRGVMWGLVTVSIGLAIMAVLFAGLFWKWARN